MPTKKLPDAFSEAQRKRSLKSPWRLASFVRTSKARNSFKRYKRVGLIMAAVRKVKP